MRKLFAALMCSLLLAACSNRSGESDSLAVEPFRMTYYEAYAPEKRYDGGEVDEIVFSYANGYHDIDPEDLRVNWTGKIRVPDDGRVLVQIRRGSSVKLKIDGVETPLSQRNGSPYYEIAPGKGEHSVSVDYQGESTTGNVVVNFFGSKEQVRTPESVREAVEMEGKDALLFAQLDKDIVLNENEVPDSDRNVPVATLPVAAHDGGVVLVLNADDLTNVVLRPEKGARIKAVIANYSIGTIRGTDAPVYRIAVPFRKGYWYTRGCMCIGGVHLSCSDGEGIYQAVQTLAGRLFGRQVDFFYYSYEKEAGWRPNAEMAAAHREGVARYREAAEKCGGSKALNFDNAISGGQKGGAGWFEQMGGEVPEQGFAAYYFTHDSIGKPFARENVPHIAIHYAYDSFHHVDAQNFAALWVGKIRVPEDVLMDMQYDLSWGHIRVRVDGKIVHEYQQKENGQEGGRFDVLLTKGEHRLEVEYINHWHVVAFSMHPQIKQLTPPDEKVKRVLEDSDNLVVDVEVYGSSALNNTIKLNLPPSDRPIVLLLSSHNSVFWQIQPGGAPLKAVIIEDGKGTVTGSKAPVYRVPRISVSTRPPIRFYQYETDQIGAGEYEARRP